MTTKAPESTGPAALTCPEGHPVDPQGRFWPECGSVIHPPTDTADTPDDELSDGHSATGFGVAVALAEAPADFGAQHPVDETDPATPPPPNTGHRLRRPLLIGTASLAGLAAILGVLYVTVTFSVPSLRGSTVAQATSSLQDRHLTVGDVSYAPDDDVEEGDVVSQGVPSGRDVRFGTPVDLVVSSGPTYHDVTVTQEVTGSTSVYFSSGNCSRGLTGYWDVSEGTGVTITGEGGELLGSGQLEATNPGNTYFCEYTATIYDIPGNHDQYTVTVGSGRRGDFTYSREEMDLYDWDFGYTLGD